MQPAMPLELAVSTVASMATIAALHVALWRSSPRPHLLWWAGAWVAFALRYSPALFGVRLQVPGPMIEFAAVRDICLIIGASLYAGHRWWRWLIVLPALELVGLITGMLAEPAWRSVWIPGRPALSAACALLAATALVIADRPSRGARRLAAVGYVVYAINTGLSSISVFYDLRFLVDQLGYFVGGVGLALAEMEAAGESRASALAQLTTAMALVLRGHVNVCRSCHHLETAAGAWVPPAKFVSGHTRASVTHGICPDCLALHFGTTFDVDTAT